MELPTVLIVDDEEFVLRAARELLGEEGVEVMTTTSPEEALDLLATKSYAVVIADQRMPLMEGTCLLEKARVISPSTVRILLTGYLDCRPAIDAINKGQVFRFITKPWDEDDLARSVQQGVAEYERMMEDKRIQESTEWQNVMLKGYNRTLALGHVKEIELGARVQEKLLLGRSFRNLHGLNLALFTAPCQRIDGDFYGFFKHHDRCLDVVVGDVMGKGVPAAILGAAIRAQFPSAISSLIFLSDGRRPEPEEVVESVHAELTEQLIELESFVTVCYTRFDLEENRVVFVNCGHPRTIYFKGCTGRCSLALNQQMPLGFCRDEVYRQSCAQIEEGDTFFFYSDGLIETQNRMGEIFGEARLTEIVQANGQRDPHEVVDKVRQRLVEFSETDTFNDDLTCIAVQVREESVCSFPNGHRNASGFKPVRSAPVKFPD